MQNVSSLYQSIINGQDYYVESALMIADNSIPPDIDLYNDGKELNPLYMHDEEEILSIKTNRNIFSHDTPEVGCCTCGEIDVQMYYPEASGVPVMARLTPYARVVPNSNGENVLIDVAPKTATLTSTSGYTAYFYFIDNKKLKEGDWYTIEYDYSTSGITTTNANIYSQLNTSIVSPSDSFVAVNTSGHHKATFSVTSAQAGYASSTRLRMRLQNANAGASFTISNVKMYSYPSEWIRKGVFFVDTRDVTKNDDNLQILTLHGYDAMLKANDTYPWSTEASPIDIEAVNIIAEAIGVQVDPRTVALIDKHYEIVAPIGYDMIETLSHIAGAYGGSFIINDLGMLQLIRMFDLPVETNILVDENQNAITFGGDRIDLGDG